MYLVDSDGRVVVLGTRIKAINIAVLKSPFKTSEDIEKNLGCKSIYDEPFPCPEDLIAYVKQDAVAKILNSGLFRIPEDERPDQNINNKT